MTVAKQCCHPNFFLIGAAKCGTTSVANYLDQHPEVFVSKPKEPNFFAFEPGSQPVCRGPVESELLYETLLKYSVSSLAEYKELFVEAHGISAIGEASVRYLYEQHTAARIADFAPDAGLIVLLRDPVDRLHSHYHMNVRQHIEPASLAEALAAERDRIDQGWGWDWHYYHVGKYADQLTTYYQHFDRSQVLILFHADLTTHPLQTMQKIFSHLGVSTDFQPDFSRRALVGHTPRWRILRRIIRDQNPIKTVAQRVIPSSIRKSFVAWSESKNQRSIPTMDAGLRQKLNHDYTTANAQLADLLGQRLPW